MYCTGWNFSCTSSVHGEDGFGDVKDIKNPDMVLMKSEHAANALVKLTNENNGNVSLAAIGPLTNVALACRLDPNFSSRLKHVVIMGGNIEVQGNAGISAEFNFYQDPEAAHIVLNDLTCQISMVTLEVCRKHAHDWGFYDKIINLGTRKADFLKKISRQYSNANLKRANYVKVGCKYRTYDDFAMAVAVTPDVVLKKQNVYATVELQGLLTRGQMIVDWQNCLKKRHNVTLIHKIDVEKLKQLIIFCLM